MHGQAIFSINICQANCLFILVGRGPLMDAEFGSPRVASQTMVVKERNAAPRRSASGWRRERSCVVMRRLCRSRSPTIQSLNRKSDLDDVEASSCAVPRPSRHPDALGRHQCRSPGASSQRALPSAATANVRGVIGENSGGRSMREANRQAGPGGPAKRTTLALSLFLFLR